MRQVDMILEVRDARLPITSGNTMLDKMTREKKRFIVFNKSDLASNIKVLGEDGFHVQSLHCANYTSNIFSVVRWPCEGNCR